MRRATLALVALMIFSLPGTAFAEDWTPEGSSDSEVEDSQLIPTFDFDDRDIERHNLLEELYEDVERVNLPPIGIKPGHPSDPNFFQLPNGPDLQMQTIEGQYQIFQLGTQNSVPMPITPNNTEPVQIKSLVLTNQTPSDEFLSGAVAWGTGLASTAFGLLTLASLNTLRLRKKTKRQ